MVHIFKGMVLSHPKKERIPFAATQKERAMMIRGEVTQRGREISYGITVRWNLKCDTKELISKATESQTLKSHFVVQKRSHQEEGVNEDTD